MPTTDFKILATGTGAQGVANTYTDEQLLLYIKADGTRAFTGVISGVTPTASTHLTTKAYVDSNVGAGFTLAGDSGSNQTVSPGDTVTVAGGSGIATVASATNINTINVGALTANHDFGSYQVKALKFESDVATGVAPIVVASTTKVTNLNADLLDGNSEAAFFKLADDETVTGDPTFGGTIAVTGVATFTAQSVHNGGVSTGALVLNDGSITDTSGSITFGNENLVTTGTFGAGVATLASTSTIGNLTLADGSITDSSGAISFGDENLTTTGTIQAEQLTTTDDLSVSGLATIGETLGVTGVATFTAQSVHNGGMSTGAMVINDGTITDTSGAITFGNENLTTTGTVQAEQLTSTDDITLSGTLYGPASFTIDPATHDDNTGTVIIAGNLQIDGTTTTVNSTTMTVDDLNITVASGASNSAAADGAGITVDGANATLIYDHTGTQWEFNKPLEIINTINPQLRLSYNSGSVDTQFGTDSSGDLTITPSGDNIFMGGGTNIGTADYASQLTGWNIDDPGGADFRYVYTDELHAKAFIADLEQALAGGQIIAKSVAVLNTTFTLPTAGNAATIVVQDLPSASGMAVFQADDYIRFRKFSRSNGSLTIADAWGKVTGHSDNEDGTQDWTFTRSASGHEGNATGSIEADAIILDYGVSGNGFHEVNAIDGQHAANSPYSQIVTWSGSNGPGESGAQGVKTRLGNLKGLAIGASGEFGLAAGSSLVANSGVYIKASSSGVHLQNASLELHDGSNVTAKINHSLPAFGIGMGIADNIALPAGSSGDEGFWVGHDGSSNFDMFLGKEGGNNIIWNGDSGSLTIKGTIQLTDGTEVVGAGMNWLGAYASGTTYAVNDGVSYQSASYICKAVSTGNVPTNTTYWNLMADQGSTGAQGHVYKQFSVFRNAANATAAGTPSGGAVNSSGTMTTEPTHADWNLTQSSPSASNFTFISNSTWKQTNGTGAYAIDTAWTAAAQFSGATGDGFKQFSVYRNAASAGTAGTPSGGVVNSSGTMTTEPTHSDWNLSQSSPSAGNFTFVSNSVWKQTNGSGAYAIDTAWSAASQFSGATGADNQDFTFANELLSTVDTSGGLAAGLLLTSTIMGYHGAISAGDGTNALPSDFTTYMDNTGNFYLKGTDGSLTWDRSGDSLTILGSITATSGYIGTAALGWDINAGHMVNGKVKLDAQAQQIKLGDITDFDPSSGSNKGVLMGQDANTGVYEFIAGEEGGDYIHWDGSSLTIVGSITLPANDISSSNISDVNAYSTNQDKQSLNGLDADTVTSATGLYMDASTFGFVENGTWKTYMKGGSTGAAGDFYLTGKSGSSGGHGLAWDASEATLTITGTIHIGAGGSYAGSSIGTSYTAADANLTAAETDSLMGWSTRPVSGSTAGATWGVDIGGSNKPANNATVGATWGSNLGSVPGRFGDTDTPGSAGLYISATHLGYHNGNGATSGWKSYIQNDGQFHFDGNSTNYIDWNGSNFNIRGNIIMNSGSIAWNSVTESGTVPYDTAGAAAGVQSNLDGWEYGDLASGNPPLTYIDSGGIYTGILIANQIQTAGAAFAATKNYDFRGNTNSWTVGNGNFTSSTAYSTLDHTSGDARIVSPTFSPNLNGERDRYVKIRFRRQGGTGWDGRVYWNGGAGTYSDARYASIPETGQTVTTSTWTTVLIDMWDLTQGGSAWQTDTAITNIRCDFGSTSSDEFDIQYVGIGDVTDSPGTYIDGDGIYTGTLNADNVNTGTLTGRTVQTASSGNRIVLDGSANTISLYEADSNRIRVLIDDDDNGPINQTSTYEIDEYQTDHWLDNSTSSYDYHAQTPEYGTFQGRQSMVRVDLLINTAWGNPAVQIWVQGSPDGGSSWVYVAQMAYKTYFSNGASEDEYIHFSSMGFSDFRLRFQRTNGNAYSVKLTNVSWRVYNSMIELNHGGLNWMGNTIWARLGPSHLNPSSDDVANSRDLISCYGTTHLYQYGGGVNNPGNALTISDNLTDSNRFHFWIGSGNLHIEDKGGAGGYISGTTDYGVLTFTGQHRCIGNSGMTAEQYGEMVGYIVRGDGNYNNMTKDLPDSPTINEALPIIELSDVVNDKRVFGVISSHEEGEKRDVATGSWITTAPMLEGDERVIVNSLGEGAIWISNINGNLENGDYITTSTVAGMGQKQDDDLLHNYTVAKITQDCDFSSGEDFEHNGETYKKQFVGCTYHCG